tara:strand:+ start:551 stop:2020 length:1470 start_codon:yes stop_codon:yes gene_type:complete
MASNISNTSQAVQALVAANPAPGLSVIDQAKNIANPGSVTQANASQTTSTAQFGLMNPNAANWGPALNLNQGLTAGMHPGYEPPIIYYNMVENGNILPPMGVPNHKFNPVANQQALLRHLGLTGQLGPSNQTPVTTGGETPITQSISAEVDKIIEESKEVVDEVITKVDPQRPPVDPVTDIIIPAAPITPTELVLDAQASCEDSIKTQDINIEIINQIEISNTSNFSASLSAQSFATSSASAGLEDFFIKGCMDPDATNFNPLANITDPNSCEYLPPEPVKGCTDINALNFNSDATEDDGSCRFDPILPPIPPMSKFLDSHGQIIFEIPSELVEKKGVVNMPKGSTVKLTATRELVNPKAINPIVRPASAAQESDLLLTVEEEAVSIQKILKPTKKPVPSNYIQGGVDPSYLAAKEAYMNSLIDTDTGTQDIIIRNVPTDTKVVRNDAGAIIISSNSPTLKVSLQSQAFIYEDYRKTIDTSFSELVGKL